MGSMIHGPKLPIVKMAVWTRDGLRCSACASAKTFNPYQLRQHWEALHRLLAQHLNYQHFLTFNPRPRPPKRSITGFRVRGAGFTFGEASR